MTGTQAAFDQVDASKLVKMFGVTRALAGVSLSLPAGCITVIEGPNGSGKSTLLAILAQLAQPTRGEVRYGKLSHRSPLLRRHIGVLAHAAMVYPDLTGRENLLFHARLHAIDDPARRIEELVERFEIGRFFDRPVRTYSRGQLQRVALARAVVHRPTLLLLDEPSTGLDHAGVTRLENAILDERTRGTILVLVTHDADLAGRVGDRRIRLDRGRLAEEDEGQGDTAT